MAQPAPGWFPDPFDPARLRWWDGERWTTRLQPSPRGPAFPASSAIAAGPAPAAPHRRRRVATVALVTAGVLLLGGGLATAAGVLAPLAEDPDASPRAASAPVSSPAAALPDTPMAGRAASPVPRATAVPPAAAGRATSTPQPAPVPSVPAVEATRPATRTPRTAATVPPVQPTGLVPVVSVTDGDTIRVRVDGVTERVRVIGVDTPELRSHQCYARRAAGRMQSLVRGKEVRLLRDPSQADRDRYGRLLRHVVLPDGRRVAKVLIAGGFGQEYTHDGAYSGQRAYRAAERGARTERRGMWGSCAAPAQVASSASCRIKGNVTRDGVRIYHVPGQRRYAATRITVSRGERWFCTGEQARDAGWRPARA